MFPGAPDIGGRYSALSNFGMVPAALIGLDLKDLFDRAERMMQACGPEVPTAENPGVRLGATLAEAARAGRDKVTFVISPEIETFADWVEQLIAESTGKEGKGLVPVAGEALGEPSQLRRRPAFRPHAAGVGFRRSDGGETRRRLKRRAIRWFASAVTSKLDLAQEFFRWEIATATAGALLGINAFDQPNVQESKDNTKRLLEQFRIRRASCPQRQPCWFLRALSFTATAETRRARLKSAQGERDLAEALLAGFLEQARPGDYAALMAYLERTPEMESQLQSIRLGLRNALRAATTLGFGPRFLHSTGQLHKGGPNNGLFLQITARRFAGPADSRRALHFFSAQAGSGSRRPPIA